MDNKLRINLNQFLKIKDDFIRKSIIRCQNENDPVENKTAKDKLNCVVCQGRYIRTLKCVHDKTKKHVRCLKDINEYVTRLLAKTLKNSVNKDEH